MERLTYDKESDTIAFNGLELVPYETIKEINSNSKNSKEGLKESVELIDGLISPYQGCSEKEIDFLKKLIAQKVKEEAEAPPPLPNRVIFKGRKLIVDDPSGEQVFLNRDVIEVTITLLPERFLRDMVLTLNTALMEKDLEPLNEVEFETVKAKVIEIAKQM